MAALQYLCSYCFLCFSREPDKDEVGFRIEVIFSGLVNHSDVPIPFCPLIGQDLVHFAQFQVFALFVLHTHCES